MSYGGNELRVEKQNIVKYQVQIGLNQKIKSNMSIIYMQSTIDNFITKNRVGEITGDPEVVELTDDKDRVINKYYKFDK